ncbi:hypothetical protein [Cytobacillus horneckiae]|uniref:hypothetical protein n=1 Tax=Cytobacillus horneckiae TaxID=549687 RepID=UPI003D9A7351
MLLTYGDIVSFLPDRIGYQDENMAFHSIATSCSLHQEKSLYIPIEDDEPDLKRALENGAIAALWPAEIEVPRYRPNHFPIFFTNDLLKGLEIMMNEYLTKLEKTEAVPTHATKLLCSNIQNGPAGLSELFNRLHTYLSQEGREEI